MHPPGLERLILKALPSLVLGGVVPGAAAALALEDTARLVALGFVVAWLLLLVPVAFGCLIVAAMKGPVRHGRDPYPGMPD
jgi:hypothetical protein